MTTFTMDKDWLVFHPSPSKPAFRPPAGAVDAHCHVMGPGEVFPYAPERKYTPCDAPKEKLWALRDHLGFARNVIVQATCHGADNGALVDALRHSDGRARGVATVRRDASDAQLRELDAAGVRGVRFNFVKRLVDVTPPEVLLEIAQRIQPLGWHVVIYFEAPDLPELYDFFTSLPTIVVFDHMGRPDTTKPVDGPEFGLFLKLMRERETFWAKVSGAERLSREGPPRYSDFVPFARRVVEEFPDRVLWGTDWPHPNLKSHMPDDGELVDLVPRIAPTAQLQRKLLVENPMRLYWREGTGDYEKGLVTRDWGLARGAIFWPVPSHQSLSHFGVKTDGSRQTVQEHPRHDHLRRRSGAQGVSPESVLHVADEGGEPRALQGERAGVPR